MEAGHRAGERPRPAASSICDMCPPSDRCDAATMPLRCRPSPKQQVRRGRTARTAPTLSMEAAAPRVSRSSEFGRFAPTSDRGPYSSARQRAVAAKRCARTASCHGAGVWALRSWISPLRKLGPRGSTSALSPSHGRRGRRPIVRSRTGRRSRPTRPRRHAYPRPRRPPRRRLGRRRHRRAKAREVYQSSDTTRVGPSSATSARSNRTGDRRCSSSSPVRTSRISDPGGAAMAG